MGFSLNDFTDATWTDRILSRQGKLVPRTTL